MTDNFADNLAARLREYSMDQSNPNVRVYTKSSLTPLQTRLRRLIDTIPESVQREGLSLLNLKARLRGRKGGMPHIGELGAAMRQLGWQRRRAWSNQDTSFSSKWYVADKQ